MLPLLLEVDAAARRDNAANMKLEELEELREPGYMGETDWRGAAGAGDSSPGLDSVQVGSTQVLQHKHNRLKSTLAFKPFKK